MEGIRAQGNPWLITDFVSVGTPMYFADQLLHGKRERSFGARIERRELPTCPPHNEENPDNNINGTRCYYSWERTTWEQEGGSADGCRDGFSRREHLSQSCAGRTCTSPPRRASSGTGSVGRWHVCSDQESARTYLERGRFPLTSCRGWRGRYRFGDGQDRASPHGPSLSRRCPDMPCVRPLRTVDRARGHRASLGLDADLPRRIRC